MNEKPGIDFERDRMESITCGIIDKRYDQCMEGTHHAVKNGRTLCGQSATVREGRTTMWFSREPLRSEGVAKEAVTCNRCLRIMGFEPVRESRVVL